VHGDQVDARLELVDRIGGGVAWSPDGTQLAFGISWSERELYSDQGTGYGATFPRVGLRLVPADGRSSQEIVLNTTTADWLDWIARVDANVTQPSYGPLAQLRGSGMTWWQVLLLPLLLSFYHPFFWLVSLLLYGGLSVGAFFAGRGTVRFLRKQRTRR
jgi:hypothetical protein